MAKRATNFGDQPDKEPRANGKKRVSDQQLLAIREHPYKQRMGAFVIVLIALAVPIGILVLLLLEKL